MLNSIISILAVLFITACSSTKSVEVKQAQIYFNSGTQSLMDADYTAALTSLLKANELSPDSSEILTNLGMAYYFKGEKDLSIKHLQAALKINPKNSDAKTNLASIYFSDKNYPQAEQIYKEVLRDLTYDKQARTYYNLGLIEKDGRKNLSGAEDYFNKSVKEDESYCPSYFQLGMIYFQRRQLNTALKNFKEAGTGTCYESAAPHYYYGLTLMELGRIDDARMKFDDVESRFKRTTFAVKARAKILEMDSIQIKNVKSPESHAAGSKKLESPEF